MVQSGQIQKPLEEKGFDVENDERVVFSSSWVRSNLRGMALFED